MSGAASPTRVPLGLNFISSVPLDHSTSRQWFSDAMVLVHQADAAGWSHVKTVEHYLYDWGGASPNPCIFLAAAAAGTRNLRVATGAVLPAFSHPVRLASELAMLDQLSNGRLDAGFARGFLPGEFDLFGVDMSESRGRFDEGVSLVKRLWTEPTVQHEGRYHTLHAAVARPFVVQRPHPPVFVAAVSTLESFERAGSEGHHLMVVPTGALDKLAHRVDTYRQARQAAGHDPDTARVQVSVQAVSGDSLDQALTVAEPAYAQYQELLAQAVADASAIDPEAYPGYARMLGAIRASTPNAALESGSLVAGTIPDLKQFLNN